MPSDKKHLISLGEEELKLWLSKNGEASFRSGQIFNWIYSKFILDPEKMLNLPPALRKKMRDSFICESASIAKKDISDDKTVKLLMKLHDGNHVEAVVINLKDKFSFCLSTQVGCPVKCSFCASGADGFVRNLGDFEIMEQFMHCCIANSSKPDNIVFMGIGEPMLNYSNLMSAIKIICDPAKIAVSPRKITISTSGLVPGIIKLAAENMPLNLAISLHAPDEKTRSLLIPDKTRHPIDKILGAAETYFRETGRIVTLEYVLIENVNDSPICASSLAKIAKRIKAKINLIPYNQNSMFSFRAPSSERILNFEKALLRERVVFTRRVRRGYNMNAACGQLRISHMS